MHINNYKHNTKVQNINIILAGTPQQQKPITAGL